MASTAIALEERKKRNKILGEDFYKEEDVTNNPSATFTNKDKPALSLSNGINKTTKGLTNDLLLGVIGGGLAGALLGKYSFFAGLAIAGYGHYSDNKMLGTVGLGMMASGTASALLGGKAQDQKATAMENATERLKGFASELKRKVWIDKWDSPEGLNGISNTNSESTKKEKIDFSKSVEPINPNQYQLLTNEEEAELDAILHNAGAMAINQFYEKRHNLNNANDEDKKVDSAIMNLENEFNSAVNGSAKNETQSKTASSIANSNSQSNKTNLVSQKNNVDSSNQENDLSGNIEDYMSNDLKKSFYENENKSSSKSNYAYSGKKNKSWDYGIDLADKLF